MHHFYNTGAEWVSSGTSIIHLQVRELAEPSVRKNLDA